MNAIPRTRRPSGALAGSLGTALLGQGSLVVSGTLAARMLGVEQRGYLALAVLLPSILGQVIHLGLPQAVTYYVARDPSCAPALLRRVRPLAIAQAAAAVLLQALLLPLFFRGAAIEVWAAALVTLIAAPCALAQQYALALLQGERRFAAFNALRLLPASSYGAAVLLLFLAGTGTLVLVSAAWAAVQVTVGAVALAVALRGLGSDMTPAPPLRRLVRFGLDGFLGAASPVETFGLDQAVIGLFLSPAALGIYVVGTSFTNLPRFVAQSIGMVAYPRVAAEVDRLAARRAMWRFTALTVVVTTVVIALLWAAAGVLVPLFFGEEFTEAVMLTRVLLIGSVFLAARRTLSDCARGLGLPRLGSIAEVASWLVVTPALALLVPPWGANGVAAALVVAAAASLGTLVALVAASTGVAARRARSSSSHEEDLLVA